MKKLGLILISLIMSTTVISQQTEKAKILLDEVSFRMKAYKNMQLNFSTTLINEEAGINEGDELPSNGKITLSGEKYNLDYLGNTFIFDGNKLYVINHDEKEITINNQDLNDDDGIIYPSKLLTFYEEGYNYSMSNLVATKDRKIQIIELIPMDSDSEIVKVNLGIDVATKHIYKLIQFGANGTKTILTIHQFKSDQNISEDMFQFDKSKYEKLDYLID
ncbi:MAG: outer membrane lipoprotein carrier protein LolA [Flavobacterium sp.]|nr:outer membrane lipoprotein carrier protein LolA [Flavobacterium sp.]